MKIIVAGAGISGLATAHVLRKKGHEVTVMAEAFSPDITSNKAAAFWFPYHVRNDKRGIGWCQRSYEVYKQLSEDAATGVSMKRLLKVVRPGVQEEELTWFSFMPEGSYRIMPKEEVPAGYAIGYDVQVPLIETQIFLPWLMDRLTGMGVHFEQRHIHSLQELEADRVVNCTALGSQRLCNDTELVPVRGQVGLIAPADDRFPIFLDNELPLYIVPRKDAMIVGGTYEVGITEAVTEPDTIDRLLNNAYHAFPELKEHAVIGSWAGLRPFRPLVRVEQEGHIIHNYGHGGSGYTLSWGCAEEVGQMLNVG